MSGEELKAAAWLYEREDGSKDLVLDCNGEYARRLIEIGATETPLYAHPLSEQPQEGWRLVPVEITQAMLDATCCDEADDRQMRDAWKALLAAAPTPPSTETKESGE